MKAKTLNRIVRMFSVGCLGFVLCTVISVIFRLPLFYLLLGFYGSQLAYEIETRNE